MLVIGLTGGIACGKSTASAALRKLGAPVFDADAVSRALTMPGGAAADAVLARFGTLERREIARIVFSDKKALADLNAIVHPKVTEAMLAFLDACRAQGERAVVLDVPLLFECGLDRYADAVWVMFVPREEQICRVMARDGVSREEALARMAAQLPTEEKCRRADACIDTSGPVEETQAHLLRLWQEAVMQAEKTRAC